MARVNWSMQADAELFRPPAIRRPGPAEPNHKPEPASGRPTGRVQDDVRLRVEYQTLRRVTDGAVLFTIRTAVEPLQALIDRPALVRDLRDALAQLPAEHREYKGMASFGEEAVRWLQRQSVP